MKSPLLRLASELLPLPTMKWLGLGLVLWTAGGCVVPQNESYLNELPIQPNRPPRIVENQVLPSERIIRGYGSEPLCELEFSLALDDPDIPDTLTVSWFVDYDPTQPRGADFVYKVEPRGNKALRDERAIFHPRFSSDTSRLTLPGDHVVEALVSDTALEGRDPQPRIYRLPNGTNINNPGYTTTYVWFVRTEAGGDCL
jgi:hypothetical protein